LWSEKHHAIFLYRVRCVRGWKVRMRAYTLCICRLVMRGANGSDILITLHYCTDTYDEDCPRKEKCIKESSRQRYDSTCRTYDIIVQLFSLFGIGQSNSLYASVSRFSFCRESRVSTEGTRNYVSSYATASNWRTESYLLAYYNRYMLRIYFDCTYYILIVFDC